MASNNLDFVSHSTCPYVKQPTPPLSTALPTTPGANQSSLADPLTQTGSSSASAAPLVSGSGSNGSNPLTGGAVSTTNPTTPVTPTPLPDVSNVAQTLAPGTYEISVSPNSNPASTTVSTSPVVSVSPPPAASVPPATPITPPPAIAVTLPDPTPIVAAAPTTPTITTSTPVVATPAPAPAPVAPVVPDYVQQVLNLTNQYRATYGIAPLTLNVELDAAALTHSQDMALSDYFAHNGLNGSTSISRMNQVGYSAVSYGENIAAGYDTPQEVVQGWIESPEHRANMLNPSFTEIGVGYYYLVNDTGANNYYSYWTQNFGSGDLNPATYV